MNDKIKELYSQVLNESENMRWNIEDAEKFAELIVQECALWIELQDEAEHPTAWLLSEELKEHFGVEE